MGGEIGRVRAMLQFIKFCIVGVSNTVVNLAVYYVLVALNKDFYLAANVIAWFVSVLNAFFWNNKVVFTGNGQDWKSVVARLLKTYVSYCATMLLSTLLLHFEVEQWGIHPFVAPVINVLIMLPVNFMINKYWAFAKKKRK